jgi:hypothetical protein
VGRLAVVVRQGVVHGVDAVEITLVELMLAARPLLALGMEVHRQHAHRLVEHADAGELQLAAAVTHHVAQVGIDQGVEHRAAIALDLDHDLFHLALGAHQRPDMLLHEDAFILNQAGTGHARHGFAGGVGDEMDVEIAVGHGATYPTGPAGEIRDWPRQSGGKTDGFPQAADSARDSPLASQPSSSPDKPGGMSCESGIRAGRPDSTAFAIHRQLGTGI